MITIFNSSHTLLTRHFQYNALRLWAENRPNEIFVAAPAVFHHLVLQQASEAASPTRKYIYLLYDNGQDLKILFRNGSCMVYTRDHARDHARTSLK